MWARVCGYTYICTPWNALCDPTFPPFFLSFLQLPLPLSSSSSFLLLASYLGFLYTNTYIHLYIVPFEETWEREREHIKGKMRKALCDNKVALKRGGWSKQEDLKLIAYINKHGEGCWRTLPQAAGLLRCGKSCRLRWINYLRPDLKRGNFAEVEEDLIIKLHALLGNRWSLIAGRLPGRTDNEVKNYWNSHLRKKLINKGIDPNNHRLTRDPLLMSGCSASSSYNSLKDNSAKNDYDEPIAKPYADKNNSKNNCDQFSNPASGLEEEEEESFCIPDLNLNLISMSSEIISSSSPLPSDPKPIQEYSRTSTELLLFR